MELKDSLAAWMQRRQLSQNALGTKAGVPQPTIQRMLSGETGSPRSATLVKLAIALGITMNELLAGPSENSDSTSDPGIGPRTPTSAEYALIPQYSTRGACGDGYLNDHVEVTGGLAFKRTWLQRLGVDEGQACVIYAHGDSMSSNINDGDVVLLDTRRAKPVDGQIYALIKDGETVIKRLQRQFGTVALHSDNPDKSRYPTITVPPGIELEIIGRVVWRGGSMF